MKCNVVLDNYPDVCELSDQKCPVNTILTLLSEAVKHACGQTTVCRDGLLQLYTIVSDITEGKGRGDDCSLLEDLCNMIILDEECPLSVKTAETLLYSIHTFPEEWEKHCIRRLCVHNMCNGCYSLYIDPELCDGCGKCKEYAPENAVLGSAGMIHIIQKDTQLKNDSFISSCPLNAIKKSGAVKPKLPESLIPVGTFKGGGLKRKRVSRLNK